MKLLLATFLFLANITYIFANTCVRCDTTFFPKEGENGRFCKSCAQENQIKLENQKKLEAAIVERLLGLPNEKKDNTEKNGVDQTEKEKIIKAIAEIKANWYHTSWDDPRQGEKGGTFIGKKYPAKAIHFSVPPKDINLLCVTVDDGEYEFIILLQRNKNGWRYVSSEKIGRIKKEATD